MKMLLHTYQEYYYTLIPPKKPEKFRILNLMTKKKLKTRVIPPGPLNSPTQHDMITIKKEDGSKSPLDVQIQSETITTLSTESLPLKTEETEMIKIEKHRVTEARLHQFFNER